MTTNILLSHVRDLDANLPIDEVKTACETALFNAWMEDTKRARKCPTILLFKNGEKNKGDATVLVISMLDFIQTKSWFFGLLTYQELLPDVNAGADKVAAELYGNKTKLIKLIITHTKSCSRDLTIQIKDKIRARYNLPNDWILCFDHASDELIVSFLRDLAKRAECITK